MFLSQLVRIINIDFQMLKQWRELKKTGAEIFRTDVNESSFWLTSNGNDIDIKEVSINLDVNGEN